MQQVLGGLAQRARSARIDANRGLQRRRPVHGQKRPLRQRLAGAPPRIERAHDLSRHVLLHRDERIVRADGPAAVANLLRNSGDRGDHRICVGEELELQSQGVQLLHPLRQR